MKEEENNIEIDILPNNTIGDIWIKALRKKGRVENVYLEYDVVLNDTPLYLFGLENNAKDYLSNDSLYLKSIQDRNRTSKYFSYLVYIRSYNEYRYLVEDISIPSLLNSLDDKNDFIQAIENWRYDQNELISSLQKLILKGNITFIKILLEEGVWEIMDSEGSIDWFFDRTKLSPLLVISYNNPIIYDSLIFLISQTKDKVNLRDSVVLIFEEILNKIKDQIKQNLTSDEFLLLEDKLYTLFLLTTTLLDISFDEDVVLNFLESDIVDVENLDQIIKVLVCLKSIDQLQDIYNTQNFDIFPYLQIAIKLYDKEIIEKFITELSQDELVELGIEIYNNWKEYFDEYLNLINPLARDDILANF